MNEKKIAYKDENKKSEKKSLFKAENIRMEFPGTIALQDVDMDVYEGEIIGLVGENGAGKSTLLKIIQGVQTQTKGTMHMYGKEFAPKAPKEAMQQGVGMVFQEQALIGNLTVGQNMFFGKEKEYSMGPLVNWKKMYKDAEEVFKEHDIKGIKPSKKINNYDFATRQMIEICKVISGAKSDNPNMKSMILLDEPTSVLSQSEIEKLYVEMRKLAKQGHAVIFVSHRLDEIMEICDRVYVFKDGRGVATLDRSELSEAILYEKMVGKSSSNEYYKEDRQIEADEEVVLEVKDLGLYGFFKNVSLKLHRSEVLGICGVVGSGKEELCDVLTGIEGNTSGQIFIEGKEVRFPQAASAVKNGIVTIPKERREEGQMGSLSIVENISISNLTAYRKGIMISEKMQRENAEHWVKEINIRCSGIDSDMNSLSGGNAQKVVFARALSADAKILILNHPTRGVDVGAKEEIYTLIRDATSKGIAVLLLGDTLDECIGLSGRIITMKDGLITKEFTFDVHDKPEQVDIVQGMM